MGICADFNAKEKKWFLPRQRCIPITIKIFFVTFFFLLKDELLDQNLVLRKITLAFKSLYQFPITYNKQ